MLVRASHDASRRAYGRPRIWKDLVEEGERVSEKRVGRLMREEGLRGPRRVAGSRSTTMSDHDQPVAANVLDRQFTADAAESALGRRHVGVPRRQRHEAVSSPRFSICTRAIVVGWAVSAVNDRHLTIKALEMAIKRRCPEAGLLHHSDQGCTYASEDYQRVARRRTASPAA